MIVFRIRQKRCNLKDCIFFLIYVDILRMICYTCRRISSGVSDLGKHSKEPERKVKKNKNKKESSKKDEKATKQKKQTKQTTKTVKNTKKSSKEKKVKAKKPRRLMKTVLTLLVLGVIVSGVYLGYKVQSLGGGVTGVLATLLGEDQETLENLEPINIVVMGISGVDDYKLADTIMIVSYNPQNQKAALISIPRDTYVGKKDRKTASKIYLESYKINTVFRNGTNIPEAMNRISALIGVDLDNYLIIDTKALIKLVDAIGGVTFNVPIDMSYDDDSQNLHIDLEAGEQLIDGAKAEQLLRFRHNNNGKSYPTEYGTEDIGRMRTQREFVTATIKQTMKPQNIFKLRRILDIMNDDVNTNLNINLMKNYIPVAVNFNVEDLQTDVLSGAPEYDNGVSIFVASPRDTKNKINKLFGPEGTDCLDTEEAK